MTPPPRPSRPPQRKLRNYLLDPRFQLKYAGALVVVALALMTALGAAIWAMANTAAGQAQTAVRQSYVAVAQAERAFRESRATAEIVGMQQLAQTDNPELAGAIRRDLAASNAQAERNLADVRRQRGAVDAQRADIERTRRRTFVVLVAAAAALVLLLGAAGIVITHRVVGPVFKLKRLLREVGRGRLAFNDRLRRGDELEDLFQTFLDMVGALRRGQEAEVARLDAALREAEPTGAAPGVVEQLRALRAEMRGALAAPAGS